MRYAAFLLATIAVAPTSRLAAQAARPDTSRLHANWTAHRGDFDYLLGDWAFTSQSMQYGAGHGLWSAVRLDAGGPILDEYRVTGDSGETYYATTTLRSYNAHTDRWELVSVDEGSGLRDIGTGQLVAGEMHIEQTFGAAGPTPTLLRIRYYDIRPDSFSWAADRSTDNGRTWVANFLRIQARRVGPPRSLGPLTHARTSP